MDKFEKCFVWVKGIGLVYMAHFDTNTREIRGTLVPKEINEDYFTNEEYTYYDNMFISVMSIEHDIYIRMATIDDFTQYCDNLWVSDGLIGKAEYLVNEANLMLSRTNKTKDKLNYENLIKERNLLLEEEHSKYNTKVKEIEKLHDVIKEYLGMP